MNVTSLATQYYLLLNSNCIRIIWSKQAFYWDSALKKVCTVLRDSVEKSLLLCWRVSLFILLSLLSRIHINREALEIEIEWESVYDYECKMRISQNEKVMTKMRKRYDDWCIIKKKRTKGIERTSGRHSSSNHEITLFISFLYFFWMDLHRNIFRSSYTSCSSCRSQYKFIFRESETREHYCFLREWWQEKMDSLVSRYSLHGVSLDWRLGWRWWCSFLFGSLSIKTLYRWQWLSFDSDSFLCLTLSILQYWSVIMMEDSENQRLSQKSISRSKASQQQKDRKEDHSRDSMTKEAEKDDSPSMLIMLLLPMFDLFILLLQLFIPKCEGIASEKEDESFGWRIKRWSPAYLPYDADQRTSFAMTSVSVVSERRELNMQSKDEAWKGLKDDDEHAWRDSRWWWKGVGMKSERDFEASSWMQKDSHWRREDAESLDSLRNYFNAFIDQWTQIRRIDSQQEESRSVLVWRTPFWSNKTESLLNLVSSTS